MTSKVFFADSVDEGMLAASRKARETFRYFWREQYWEYRRIIPGLELAFVKAAFADGDTVEHMWVNEIDFDGYIVTGKLANEPNELSNVHVGDIVKIDIAETLTDWMISKEGEIFGAFTIQEMRKRMSDEERQAHDDAWQIDFGDPNEAKIPIYSNEDHPMAVNMVDSFVKFLTEHPEELTGTIEGGRTLLHNEAIAGNGPIVEVILKFGGRKVVQTAGGDTPYDLAIHMGWERVAELLK